MKGVWFFLEKWLSLLLLLLLLKRGKNKLVVVTMEELKSGANEGNQGTLHQRLPWTFQGFLSYTPTNATYMRMQQTFSFLTCLGLLNISPSLFHVRIKQIGAVLSKSEITKLFSVPLIKEIKQQGWRRSGWEGPEDQKKTIKVTKYLY